MSEQPTSDTPRSAKEMIAAMRYHDGERNSTPSLAEFLKHYEENDNIWWMISCGHHMNLFDDAVAQCERAIKEAEKKILLQEVETNAQLRAENAELRKRLDRKPQPDAPGLYAVRYPHTAVMRVVNVYKGDSQLLVADLDYPVGRPIEEYGAESYQGPL